jgi:hypothetical protein
MKRKEGNNMLYDEIPQLQSEVDKMDQENRVIEMKAKSYIDGFVNDIKKMDRSELVKTTYQPQKIKIPLKYRIKRFFERLNKTLGE